MSCGNTVKEAAVTEISGTYSSLVKILCG